MTGKYVNIEEITEGGILEASTSDFEIWRTYDDRFYKIYTVKDNKGRYRQVAEELTPEEMSEECQYIEDSDYGYVDSDGPYGMYGIYLNSDNENDDEDDYINMLGDFND